MHENASGVEMVMAAPQAAMRSSGGERWPLPLATLFIVGTSLVLWSGIFLVARAVLG